MSEVKTYRVKGEILDPKMRTNFTKEVRALKPEQAIEKVYCDFGSKHKLKRHSIRILKVEELEVA
jgi:large subunit ribosomal protein LX